MLDLLLARWKQGHQTFKYPAGPPPVLPQRFAGKPTLQAGQCTPDCNRCLTGCPTQALKKSEDGLSVTLDLGKCLFCRACEHACPKQCINFSADFQLAASNRAELCLPHAGEPSPIMAEEAIRKLLGRALKLRQVSAGGCNACEADTNVLTTIGWDLSRFGIAFVASPRHADGLLVTGPVTQAMRSALEDTYAAIPHPKIVIAVGACAVSGGLFADHQETCGGVSSLLPVDLFIPGCPPHPLTILHGILAFLGKLAAESDT